MAVQAVEPSDQNDPTPIVIAGNILLTKDEVVAAAANGTLGALLRGMAKNIESAFLNASISRIEELGWATVEYAKNGTE